MQAMWPSRTGTLEGCVSRGLFLGKKPRSRWSSPVAGGGDSKRLIDEARDVGVGGAEHFAGFGLHFVLLA